MSIHDFIVRDARHQDVSLADYKGKVLLIVNTATGCGFTPQYEGLEKLYKKYRDQGFEVLDFPCNQFLNQAPGTEEEIVSFCQLNYGVTFKTFEKIEVNGENAAPLYTFLKSQKPEDTEDDDMPKFLKRLKEKGLALIGTDIKWNFTKFLIDRDGKVVARFAPTIKPEAIDDKIAALLAK